MTSRRIEALSPFSKNRKYNIPKGKGIEIKKSDKGPTEFAEFKSSEGNWKVGQLYCNYPKYPNILVESDTFSGEAVLSELYCLPLKRGLL